MLSVKASARVVDTHFSDGFSEENVISDNFAQFGEVPAIPLSFASASSAQRNKHTNNAFGTSRTRIAYVFNSLSNSSSNAVHRQGLSQREECKVYIQIA